MLLSKRLVPLDSIHIEYVRVKPLLTLFVLISNDGGRLGGALAINA